MTGGKYKPHVSIFGEFTCSVLVGVGWVVGVVITCSVLVGVGCGYHM